MEPFNRPKRHFVRQGTPSQIIVHFIRCLRPPRNIHLRPASRLPFPLHWIFGPLSRAFVSRGRIHRPPFLLHSCPIP